MLGKIVDRESEKSLSVKTFLMFNGIQLHSFDTVKMNDWMVRVSITNIDSIMVVLQNPNTLECKVGFFYDELLANKFINSFVYAS